MSALSTESTVAIIGSGAMGNGIAQVALNAGHPVVLYDVGEGAAERGRDAIAERFQGLVAKGKLNREQHSAMLNRLRIAGGLDDLADAGLCIEAIPENLALKQSLFGDLEALVGPQTLLATNTSSLSITAIARTLQRPERLAGMHFFNPAPAMRLVEIVAGSATSASICERLAATARAWGKTAVLCRSTPGFIVNRVARPFYGEALRLLEEGSADIATIDALLTASGGFRMGPFALMDMIGHDVNFAVTCSIFDAYFGDPRFKPSLAQKDLVDAGWLGRKAGRGFYDYRQGASPPTAVCEPTRGGAFSVDRRTLGKEPRIIDGTLLAMTDGRTALQRSKAMGKPVVLYDYIYDPATAERIGLCLSPDVSDSVASVLIGGLQNAGFKVSLIADRPGMVVARTLSMLINEAYETALHGVASAEAIDSAMRLGVNYPMGPFEWAARFGERCALGILDALLAATGDTRYRASIALREHVDRERLTA